jgi:hypothetical protein
LIVFVLRASALPTGFLYDFPQWGEHIVDDAALPLMDLGGDVHAWRKMQGFTLWTE